MVSAVLSLRGIGKTYGGVRALRGVTLEVASGEVHALLGENGAGKSTLMAVAAGAVAAEEGTVEIGGSMLANPSPVAARALGLGVVYQHPTVLGDLTVAENLALALPIEMRPSYGERKAWAASQLHRLLGLGIDPGRRGDELTTTERSAVEICKVLSLDPRVVILDEPTAMLNALEVERLFAQVRAIRDKGTAVIYISHRLPEVSAIADRVTILRDGEHKGCYAVGELSESEILDKIVGRNVDQVFPSKANGSRARAGTLELRDFGGRGFADLSLVAQAGEIVGFAGAEGNGQRDALRAIGGLEPHTGTALLNGSELSLSGPDGAQGEGVRYLPSDRQNEGIFEALSVRENMVASTLHQLQSWGVVRPRDERERVRGEVASLMIRAPSLDAPVSALSGGNQQKVVFGRALLGQADVFLCDEPTQGVDAGARVEIYNLLRELADEGTIVIVLSSDVLELEGLCDRVAVFSRGQIVSVLEDEEVGEGRISAAALQSGAARLGGEPSGRKAPRFSSITRRLGVLGGDHGPALILLIAIVALGLYTNGRNSAFTSGVNVEGFLFVAAALIFVSLGQITVMLVGGIDLSVGPQIALTVVVMSFFLTAGAGAFRTALGFAAALAAGCLVGLANGLLVRKARISPIIATLAMFIVLQGVGLLLRPQPSGVIAVSYIDFVKTTTVAAIPIVFLIAIAVAVVTDVAMRRTRFGLNVRAIGSSESSAHRMGIRVTPVTIGAYIVCALFAAIGGLVVTAQVGIGDPSVGGEYSLLTITAAVLGGTSIYGGRGSYIGGLMGAVLLVEITNATSFLSLSAAWQYWLPAILILVAAALFSRAQGIRTSLLDVEAR